MSRLSRVAILAMGIWLPSAAYAFVPSGFRVDLPVRYEVNTASSAELGRNTTLQVIDDSYTNWASPLCSGYSFQLTGETNDGWVAGDRTNTLIWIYNANQRPRELGGRSTIGVTLTVTQGNQGIDGDILFNGIDHSWTTNVVREGQVDAVSIITHETGHQLGLNHSPFQSATMYAAYLGGNAAASISEDDIEGVCTLYPSGQDPECRNDGDCPGEERCIGGECIDGPAPGGAMIGDDCVPGDCAPGLFCAQTRGGDTFCTRECGGGCPEGWDCTRVQQNNGQIEVCLPGQGAGGDNGAFGDPCDGAQDCASGFCVSNGREAFCSQACGGDGDCPPASECVGTNGGGGACIPSEGDDPGNGNPGNGGNAFGESCDDHGECDSMVCVGTRDGGGFCSELCNRASDCPNGADCQEASNGQGVCVPGEGPGNGQYGDLCDTAEECQSELCVDDGTNAFCSERCNDLDDCPPGTSECANSNSGGVCLPGADPRPPPPGQDAGLPPLDDLPTLDSGTTNGNGNGGTIDAATGQGGPGPMNPNAADGGPNGRDGNDPAPTVIGGTPQGGGCACSASPDSTAPLGLVWALGLLGWRFRRRRLG